MLDETYFKKSLEFNDVEHYREVTGSETEKHAYSVFYGLLEDKNPEEEELERFLRELNRNPDDEFLKGIYDAGIDFAEEKDYLPLNLV